MESRRFKDCEVYVEYILKNQSKFRNIVPPSWPWPAVSLYRSDFECMVRLGLIGFQSFNIQVEVASHHHRVLALCAFVLVCFPAWARVWS